MDVSIRWLTAGDAEMLHRFGAVFTRGPGLDDAEASSLLSGGVAEILTATVGDEPAGWAITYVLPYAGGGWMVLLYDVEVAPAHRRRGIGRQLLTEILDRSQQTGRSRLWLMTPSDNTPAVELYRHLGGTETKDTLFIWKTLPDTQG